MCFTHTHTHVRSLMLYALTDTQNQIVVWQQDWLLYLSCCYSNKHPSLSLICCAKQSPYQHLAHHAALCQSGPQCQDCQPMTEAQTHFLSHRLPHGFAIILLSLPHQTAKKHNLWCAHFLRTGWLAPCGATARPVWENIVFFCSCTLILAL